MIHNDLEGAGSRLTDFAINAAGTQIASLFSKWKMLVGEYYRACDFQEGAKPPDAQAAEEVSHKILNELAEIRDASLELIVSSPRDLAMQGMMYAYFLLDDPTSKLFMRLCELTGVDFSPFSPSRELVNDEEECVDG